MRKFLNLFLIVFLLFSCQSDDDNQVIANTDIELVTGIFARNSEFGPIIKFGNPNVYISQVLMYPNPAIDVLSIIDQGNSGITDIWIVKCEEKKIFQEFDFGTVLNPNLYLDSEINDKAEYYFTINESNNTLINLDNYEKGYYKVFVKINNQIEWNNIYVGNDMDIDDLMSFWD